MPALPAIDVALTPDLFGQGLASSHGYLSEAHQNRMQIEIQVARTAPGFVTLISTTTNSNEKHHKATVKANRGKPPGFDYVLAADGKLRANVGASDGDHHSDAAADNDNADSSAPAEPASADEPAAATEPEPAEANAS